ncbi:type II secretory pathway pseudopilin PulG [Microbacterium sp. W4I4]|uniref:PilW family protein n=1 Tax=Microbacterium sp. W4I4 TaxID=3042295 RepID=UPI002783D8EE|nr:hypothetical protein [Microbacterium sp. W4I4]MDQ0614916.1 type II secretory pathway pseudopilin PulG [Microbacterium sp. W4I4]
MNIDDESGLSLIELIIYVLILGVITAAIAMLFINTLQTEKSVRDQTAATTRGQLISSQIERAVRNAEAFAIEDGGATLKVNSVDRNGTTLCQGFTFSGGDVRMVISDSPSATPSSWPAWQDGVKKDPAKPYFSASGADAVTYAFDATNPDLGGSPVRFTGNVYMRNTASGSVSPCW